MKLRETIEIGKLFKHEILQRRVSTEGIRRINEYLHGMPLREFGRPDNVYGDVHDDALYATNLESIRYLPSLPFDWDWDWTVQKGTYRGKVAKRIAQYYRETLGIDLSGRVQEEIGTITGRHRVEPATYYFDFNNTLDWNAGDFGDETSCFWQSRTKDRYTLMYNQAWAVRLFRDAEGKQGFARAWIVPDTPKDGQFVIFNGYGYEGDSTMEVAKIVAQHFGWGLREIQLRNKGERTQNFFFNANGRGIVIGAEDTLEDYNPRNLARNTDDYFRYDFRWATNVIGQCCITGEWLVEDKFFHHHRGRYYSREGYNQHFAECTVTGQAYPRDELVMLPSGALVCETAWRDMTIPCHYCTQRELKERFHWLDGSALMVCQDCFDRHCVTCEHNHQMYLREDTTFIEDNGFYSEEGIRHYADNLINELGVVPVLSEVQLNLLEDAHVLNPTDVGDLSYDSVSLGIGDALAASTLQWADLNKVFHPQTLLAIKCYNTLWWKPLQKERV